MTLFIGPARIPISGVQHTLAGMFREHPKITPNTQHSNRILQNIYLVLIYDGGHTTMHIKVEPKSAS